MSEYLEDEYLKTYFDSVTHTYNGFIGISKILDDIQKNIIKPLDISKKDFKELRKFCDKLTQYMKDKEMNYMYHVSTDNKITIYKDIEIVDIDSYDNRIILRANRLLGCLYERMSFSLFIKDLQRTFSVFDTLNTKQATNILVEMIEDKLEYHIPLISKVKKFFNRKYDLSKDIQINIKPLVLFYDKRNEVIDIYRSNPDSFLIRKDMLRGAGIELSEIKKQNTIN